MKRMHLVELEDLPWLPAVMRDGGRDALDVMFGRVHFYRALVPKLRAWMAATGQTQLTDLCSGSGGGALAMYRELRAAGVTDVHMELTDWFPNDAVRQRVVDLGDSHLHYRTEPVNAMQAPRDLPGMRTMFTATHHFTPEQIQQMLGDAVAAGAPVAFFDMAASPVLRSLPAFMAPLVTIPVALFLATAALVVVPMAKPFRVSRLVCTYLLPLVPFLFAWDGSVSVLRAYLPEELRAIAAAVPGAEGYVWEAGRAGNALYLLGRLRDQTA